jgi:topoisomerase-4 subunit A
VLYFTANPNGEAEIVKVSLTSASKARVKALDFDFSELDIKGRTSQGNIISKYPIRKVSLKQAGMSTLSAITIWYDAAVGRLNTDGVGANIGKFDNEDQILVIYRSGEYELTNYELTNRYEP